MGTMIISIVLLSNMFKISVRFSEKVCLPSDFKNRLIALLFGYLAFGRAQHSKAVASVFKEAWRVKLKRKPTIIAQLLLNKKRR